MEIADVESIAQFATSMFTQPGNLHRAELMAERLAGIAVKSVIPAESSNVSSGTIAVTPTVDTSAS